VPGAPESVHLCDFPVSDATQVDPDMERQMDALLEVVQLGRACRNTANMKVRQPAQRLYVKGASFEQAYQELCEDELNVREVIFTEDARAFTTYLLKPQMRTLGPKYGKLLGKIGAHLKEMDGNDVVDAFARGETVSFQIDGTDVVLAEADVLTEPMQKPGFTAAEDRGVTVVLDTNLTEELIHEGYAREVISKLQTMRKEAGFEVTDRIHAVYTGDDELAAALEKNAEMIQRTTLALSLKREAPGEGCTAKEWDINGKKATLGIRKA
jgi:isoleucyl-tRNA synthetase